MEIQNSQYTTIKWCLLCFIHDICSLSWTLYDGVHTSWLKLTISFNGHFHMRRKEIVLWTKFQWHKMFWNEILLSELILIKNASADIVIYTKQPSMSYDRSVYLNPFDCVFFWWKIWGFLFTKNKKNRLCFSCYNIQYTYKIRDKKSIRICYE